MTTLCRIRGVLGINKNRVPGVLTRAQMMFNGMSADPVTYSDPVPPLPVFQSLIENLASSQQQVLVRGRGGAAERDVQRDLLITGMESERMYTQSLADAAPARAIPLIENAGLLIAGAPVHGKDLLTLRHGKQSGSVDCDAYVGLLVRTGGNRPREGRFFNWEVTVNGGLSFTALAPTTRGKITVYDLTPLTMVGVRVNLNGSDGPGPWSQVVTLLVL
jgi:hypothetical protein